jgi:hypothetical protein
MDTELREILNKVYKQEMRPDEAQWKICVLFNVSGSLPFDGVSDGVNDGINDGVNDRREGNIA